MKQTAPEPVAKELYVKHNLMYLAVLMAAASPAYADTGAVDLDSVVVTATRTESTLADTLASVETIEREQIERSSARSLPELLRGRAGVTVVNQGGLGKLSSLFVRGTESDHTLILIDGVRVGSATSGMTALQDLPLDQIERIEIVRGPRSSLYGADALGGVIQIFTRRASDAEGFTGRGRVAIGSNNLREASAGLDLRGKTGGVGIDLSHQRTDGINACLGMYNPGTFAGAGCFIVPGTHLDRDGYENTSATVRADLKPTETLQLEARAFRTEGETDFDGDYSDHSEIVQQVLSASATWTPSEAVRVKLSAGRNTDKSDNYAGNSFANSYTSWRTSASLQADFKVHPNHTLTAGLDWNRDKADVVDPWSPFAPERDNKALFGQYLGEFGPVDVQVSGRKDDNEQFGESTTGAAAVGLEFAKGWRITASHGTAFKAPSFNELYYPGYSNPNLDPESSKTSELSLSYRAKSFSAQLSAYDTKVDDLIAYDSSVFAPNNIDHATIRGYELTAGLTAGGWDLRGQVSKLKALDASGSFNDGKFLARRPEHSARIDIDRNFTSWGVGASVINEGARWDNAANTLRVDGYTTVDAHLSWYVSSDWTVQLNVVNLLDVSYETSSWYQQPGREFTLSVRWTP